jgi:hypothetical protein
MFIAEASSFLGHKDQFQQQQQQQQSVILLHNKKI